jgi:hypothetical protein
MPRRPSPKQLSRNAANVQQSLENSLMAYAVAAGAAGVSLLALTQPAEAKIVFTPAHQTIQSGGIFRIDLNGDGVTDFTLTDSYHTSFRAGIIRNTGSIHPSGGAVGIYGAVSANQVVEATNPPFFVAALGAGVAVSSKNTFVPPFVTPDLIVCEGSGGFASHQSGQFLHATNKYVGLKFVINGQPHYGWARLNVRLAASDIGCQYQVTLAGFAYETIANKQITAGQTKGPTEVAVGDNLLSPPPEAPSLGVLAQGARGLAVWRREEEVIAS